jgi:uncharacterized protein YndB with AHSA1/START domain
MRYADGPETEVQVHVNAPVARVWELISDVDLPGRFSEEFQGAEWLDGAAGPAVGVRFKGRNHHPEIGEWETVSFITECEHERVLAWAVNDPDQPGSSWRFELEPDGDGTRLRQRGRLGPGPSGTSVEIELSPDDEERIVERRLAEHRVNMQRTVEGIKQVAEGG